MDLRIWHTNGPDPRWHINDCDDSGVDVCDARRRDQYDGCEGYPNHIAAVAQITRLIEATIEHEGQAALDRAVGAVRGLGTWLDQEHTTTLEDVGHIWPWVVLGFVVLVLGFIGGFLS